MFRAGRWADFLVVSRGRLREYYNGPGRFGSLNRKNEELEITVEFRTGVECSGRDLTDRRNGWASLPPLQPLPDPAGPATTPAGGT